MTASLESIIRGLASDPGLKGGQTAANISKGIAAARELNSVLLDMIDRTKANADGRITAADLVNIRAATYADKAAFVTFLEGHGNDEGANETGYHLLQNNDGSLIFQGRNFADTVIDAIYHFGFKIINGRYVNEDGNENELAVDVAGWLNFFLNGKNIVYGSAGNDELGTGEYSTVFAAAANETFDAGAGNDKIWAGKGHDTVLAGAGNDMSGGGAGNDRMYGGAGDDDLWGDEGGDGIRGEAGNDEIGGGAGNDTLDGGDGNDKVYGDDGADSLFGGAGLDELHGGKGRDVLRGEAGADKLFGGEDIDVLSGGDGNDKLNGGEGADALIGGKGADVIELWENAARRDVIVFKPGDSGRTLGTIDSIEGFDQGMDVIDLRGFGPMRFVELDFTGGGKASCYYDGRYLRIDQDGDRATDMMVKLSWVDDLKASDFVLTA